MVRQILAMAGIWAGIFIGLCSQMAMAQNELPPGSKPLSKILQLLEQKKIQPARVVLDDRKWVVDGLTNKESVRLHVDPRTGRITQRETIPDLDPVEGALPVSRILEKLEAARPGPVRGVRYQKKRWLVETHNGKVTTEIQVSAETGNLLMGRDEN